MDEGMGAAGFATSDGSGSFVDPVHQRERAFVPAPTQGADPVCLPLDLPTNFFFLIQSDLLNTTWLFANTPEMSTT